MATTAKNMELADTAQLTASQLAEPGMREQLVALADELIASGDTGQADDLQIFIGRALQADPGMAEARPELFAAYQELRRRLRLFAFHLQTHEEIEGFVRRNLLDMIRRDFELAKAFGELTIGVKSKIAAHLVTDDMTDDSPWRFGLLAAMQDNEQEIGAAAITVAGRQARPTVGNWLADYEAFFEAGKVRTELERANYASNAANTKHLSKEERDLLRKVLEIYDFLRFYIASQRVQEYREWSMLRDVSESELDRLVDTEPPEVTGEVARPRADGDDRRDRIIEQTRSQRIMEAWKGDPEREQAIAALEEELRARTNGQYAPMGEMLYDMASPRTADPRDADRLVALLRVMAGKDMLERVVKDPKLSKLYREHLQSAGKEQELSDFRVNPADPRHLSHMLQYLLKDRMGMRNSAAARVGVQLAGIMAGAGNEKYAQMAFWDEEIGEFNWADRL